jgi:hypothetical protein
MVKESIAIATTTKPRILKNVSFRNVGAVVLLSYSMLPTSIELMHNVIIYSRSTLREHVLTLITRKALHKTS